MLLNYLIPVRIKRQAVDFGFVKINYYLIFLSNLLIYLIITYMD